MPHLPDALPHRHPEWPIESIFLRRWSPRAMSGEPLTDEELMRLFEAARWAPSTYNEQEWRFLYAASLQPALAAFFDLLMDANKVWCQRAAVLVVVLSHRVFTRNGNPNPVHTFDTGAAFENLALQGTAMDLVVHGMAGFDRDESPHGFARARRLRGGSHDRHRPPRRPERPPARASPARAALRPPPGERADLRRAVHLCVAGRCSRCQSAQNFSHSAADARRHRWTDPVRSLCALPVALHRVRSWVRCCV